MLVSCINGVNVDEWLLCSFGVEEWKHNITKGVLLLQAEVESEQPPSDQKGWSIYPPTASGTGVLNLALTQVLPIWLTGADTFRDKRNTVNDPTPHS